MQCRLADARLALEAYPDERLECRRQSADSIASSSSRRPITARVACFDFSDACDGGGFDHRRDLRWMTEIYGGATGARTPDLLHAMQMLSQLSYRPVRGRI